MSIFEFERWHGTEQGVTKDGPGKTSSRVTHKYRGLRSAGGQAMPAGFSDWSDVFSSTAMGKFIGSIPGPDGTILFPNAIQVSEETYGMVYHATVEYGPEDKQSGSYTLSYSGTGGTAHVSAGTRVAGYALKPEDVVDNGGLIGKDGEEVKGTDVPIPQTRLTVSYRHPKAFLNRAYLESVTSLTGHYNSDVFLGYQPGEVRFSGPDATESEAEATAQYSFEISRNMANFKVAGITIPFKKGWWILSPIFHDKKVGGQGVRQMKCIEVIKDPGGIGEMDFSGTLGWGGS